MILGDGRSDDRGTARRDLRYHRGVAQQLGLSNAKICGWIARSRKARSASMKTKVAAQSILGMKIKEIMTRELATIPPDATIRAASQLMRDRDVGMLPVIDRGRLLGLLTDRDIVIRAIADNLDTKKIPVREIMTTELFYCYEYEDVADAVECMQRKQIRRLLILNRTKRLVGVLSIGDLAVDTGDRQLAGQVLKKVSQPDYSIAAM